MKKSGDNHFSFFAEWHEQKAVWTAWPGHADLWEDDFEGAKNAVSTLVKAITEGGVPVNLLVNDGKSMQVAQSAFSHNSERIQFFEIPFGDIWLRDTAPLFVLNGEGKMTTVRFLFNGWGEKYILEGDKEVSKNICRMTAYPNIKVDFILEGGAIEGNGQGVLLTTRQCLLHPNRNKNLEEKDYENLFRKYLGIEKVIWLNQGLQYDHTDGHIDNVARFINENTILCMTPESKQDPQHEILLTIQKELEEIHLKNSFSFEIKTLPSPGKVLDSEGKPLPASYLNFFISNQQVLVPTFQCPSDEQALSLLEEYFPGKKILGIDCRNLLAGGGSLHCITQPEFDATKDSP